MTTIIVGLFDNQDVAQDARQALVKKGGCPEDAIHLFHGDREDVQGTLSDMGVEEEDGRAFAGAIARGAALLTAEIEERRADDLLSLLEDNGARAVDAYEEEEEEEQQQQQRRQKDAKGATETKTLREIEEEVEIGKRRVARGGVRATTRVHETPVEETVRLREEHVDVQRREGKGRELSPEEAEQAFEEKSVEVTETGEEAKVRKAAKLMGEVEITKQTEEREEKVKEKARRTEVEVEKMEPEKRKK